MSIYLSLPARLSKKLTSLWERLFGKRGNFDGASSSDRPRKRSQTFWQVIKALNDRFWLKDLFLTVILVMYAFIGGLFFHMIECPVQASRVKHQKEQHELQRGTMVEHLIKLQAECTVLKADACRRLLSNAVAEYERKVGAVLEPADSCQFLGSVFYASTILTTIGYGHLSCYTTWGRAATIIYAIIGIPLMLTLVNGLGKRLFLWARRTWNRLRRFAYRIHNKYVISIDRDSQWPPVCRAVSVCSITSAAMAYEEVDDVDFPLALSLGIVILYILVCAAIFMMWERRWDYFTALYFFFISLSTIGFGDVVPESIAFTLIGFPFYVIGLSLVSVCINVIQAKVERSCDLTVDQIYRGLETLMSKVGNEVTINGVTAVAPGQRRLSVVQEAPEIDCSCAKEGPITGAGTPVGEQQTTETFSSDVIQISRSPGERKITLRRMSSRDADQWSSTGKGLTKSRSQLSCLTNGSDWSAIRMGSCSENVSIARQSSLAAPDVPRTGRETLRRTPAFRVAEQACPPEEKSTDQMNES